MARIVSVNISAGKGERKHNIGTGLLKKDLGLAEDGHAGFGHRQVSLLAKESIDKMRAQGLDVSFGDFAENLTVEGMELCSLPIGTELTVGKDAVLRVTQIGKVCHDRCRIYYLAGDCVMPREGIFAEVLAGGEVSVGDEIEIKSN